MPIRDALATQVARQPVGLALALVAGAATPFAFAPFNLWPLAIIGPTCLLLALYDCNPRTALLRGWIFGAGFYGTGVSWVYVSIHEFGYAPAWLAFALTGLFVSGLALMPAVLAWMWQRWFSHSASALALGFPGAWILCEWFRYWFLSGFPWNYLGYALLDTPLAGWAPIGGVYALSWIAASAAGVMALWILPGRSLAVRAAGTGMVVAITCVGWQLDQKEWTQAVAEPPVQVALIQGNISQDLKWQKSQIDPTLNTYATLSAGHQDADLIVWPEAAIPVFLHEAGPFLDHMAQFATDTETGIITGIPYWGINPASPGEPIMHNSIVGFGNAGGLYHKQKLVPFGEYVPLENLLRGIIRFMDLPMSNFSRGRAGQNPLSLTHHNRTLTIAPFICYEIVYPDFVARNFRASDLLLTISNDAWFGASAGPAQHLQIARMRARELGREVIRATNDGWTAIIDTRGQVRASAKRFQRTVLTGEAHAYTGLTPFARWGSGMILVIGLILTLLTRRVRPA